MTTWETIKIHYVHKSTLGDKIKGVVEGKEVEIKTCLWNGKAFSRTFIWTGDGVMQSN